MKALSLILLIAPALVAYAEEIAIIPKFDSVGLFKNGLCVVQGTFDAPAAGIYRWENPPRSVHGTFFFESASPVAVQSTEREMTEALPTEQPTGNLQTDLAGSTVKLTLANAPGTPPIVVTGKVWAIPARPTEPRVWDTSFGAGDGFGNSALSSRIVPPALTTGSFLVLESAAEVGAQNPSLRRHIALSSILQIDQLTPAPRQETKRKPLLLFNVTEPGKIRISYLTKGASWVPAYDVELQNARTLKLRQTAVVKNELMALQDTEVNLITGFPNVAFGHVDSPLWQGTSLAAFFQQLSSRGSGNQANAMLQNSVAYNSRRTEVIALPDLAEPGASSEDLHYESLGRRSLALGDALSLDVAAGETAYERVVEWTMPDPRDAYGIYANRSQPAEEDQPWDALLFQNPLKFPMTTAAATIRQEGKFLGQSQSNWTNPGQRSCLRITKALSLQTDHSEVEAPGKREEEIWMGGNRYYRTTVKGQATVRNFRAAPLTLLMRVQFSGNLAEADEKPADTLRREGVFSVNARHELEWKLSIAPNEEKKVNYTYTVLVRN